MENDDDELMRRWADGDAVAADVLTRRHCARSEATLFAAAALYSGVAPSQ